MFKGKTPLLIALCLGLSAGALSFMGIKARERQVTKGWNLVPVLVADRDLPEGTVISNEMVAQREVPEQFVTSSVVRPDAAQYIYNQKVLVPLLAGDPWVLPMAPLADVLLERFIVLP